MRAGLALAGAIMGGALGYWGFVWAAQQGFYALALPGALAGVGAGFAKSRSWALAAAIGVLGTLLCLFAEWKFAPFQADDSFGYLLRNIGQLKPITLLMVAVGGLTAFWFARDHRVAAPPA